MARERGGGEMGLTTTRTLKGRKGDKKIFFLQKAKKGVLQQPLQKIMRLLRSLFLRPAIPSASREALVPERAYYKVSL
jgi:hypothetical protein